MTDILIEESEMIFGPFQEEHCFHIEQSGTYKRIEDGVKMAEFILLKNPASGQAALWIVEAKSSAPQVKGHKDFDRYISEIQEKFVNALALGWTSCLRRHAESRVELPAAFRQLDLEKVTVKFILVIRKKYTGDWHVPLRDALEKALRATRKTWAFLPPCAIVMNEDGARSCGLIQATA